MTTLTGQALIDATLAARDYYLDDPTEFACQSLLQLLELIATTTIKVEEIDCSQVGQFIVHLDNERELWQRPVNENKFRTPAGITEGFGTRWQLPDYVAHSDQFFDLPDEGPALLASLVKQ